MHGPAEEPHTGTKTKANRQSITVQDAYKEKKTLTKPRPRFTEK